VTNKFPYFMKILEERVLAATSPSSQPSPELWEQARGILETSVAPAEFATYVAPLSVQQGAGELILLVPTEEEASWVAEHLGKQIRGAVEAAGWSGPIVVRVYEEDRQDAGDDLPMENTPA
jgi:chromosomal replication initiation ATPase DnaA